MNPELDKSVYLTAVRSLAIIIVLCAVLGCQANYASGANPIGLSTITYRADGQLYEILAYPELGLAPRNISTELAAQFGAGKDEWLNISPDGRYLLLSTERSLDTACGGWACLVLSDKASISQVPSFETIKVNGGVIHAEGFSAVAAAANRILVIYPHQDGPHEQDLWMITRPINPASGNWSEPLLLTGNGPHNYETYYNSQPAISYDGSKVIFDCGPSAYGQEKTAICEVNTDGTGEVIVLATPADIPIRRDADADPNAALHHPDYTRRGIVFEASGESYSVREAIWQLDFGSSTPKLVAERFSNDNSPCALNRFSKAGSNGIVSLWLSHPENDQGNHEIKVMSYDGTNDSMVLTGTNVDDIGLGCN